MEEIPGTVQLLAYAIAVLLGFGGKSGVDRLRNRRNGTNGISRDAGYLAGVIREEGKHTRGIMSDCAKAITDLRIEVAKGGHS